eukprot:767594-Hanusia_phi.AAC.11
MIKKAAERGKREAVRADELEGFWEGRQEAAGQEAYCQVWAWKAGTGAEENLFFKYIMETPVWRWGRAMDDGGTEERWKPALTLLPSRLSCSCLPKAE